VAIKEVFSVSEVTNYLKTVIEDDPQLQEIWVVGEISNLSKPASGHIYFTLKDEGAALRCVIWKWQAKYLQAGLQEGLAVEAHGSFGVYEHGGNYQFYVNGLRHDGEGALYQEFLRLKTRLEAEGLFSEERKRPLPPYPQVIGIVTSPTGAALQDMLNVFQERYPIVEIVLAPTLVQGADAPPMIAAAIQRLNQEVKPDIILLARGGGSLEDLWPFNEEITVRAIINSSAPVISGVGHETDFTLADFAADLRAPTPTAAAVSAAPHVCDLFASLEGYQQLMVNNADSFIQEKQQQMREMYFALQQKSPHWLVRQDMQRLDEISVRLSTIAGHALQIRQANLGRMESRIHNLNPQIVLGRGYALVSDKRGLPIDTIRKVQSGMEVGVQLQDGKFNADVKEIEKK